MVDIPSLRHETRYGMPAADQILFNRHYVLGYSYYFRQAKWALELINPVNPDVKRIDNFRPDYRIPEMFRANLEDFENSGFDRGHLVASANKQETALQNSETFLLSNMSPQPHGFNNGIWKRLEIAIRTLNDDKKVYETYVICGPIFDFDIPVQIIGTEDDNGVTLPVPNAYFKSILTENNRGTLRMWSFIIPNKESDKPLEDFLVSTKTVETMSGILLWDRLMGKKIDRKKNKIRRMW